MRQHKVVILGGGMIGSAIAMDLRRRAETDVTVADLRAEVRERIEARYGVNTVAADLSRPEAIAKLVAGYDLVVGALPSVLGYQTLEAVIAAGKDYCDISPAAIMAGLMLEGGFRRPGVHAPESVGREPGLLDRMLAELKARGVVCHQAITVEEPVAAFA